MLQQAAARIARLQLIIGAAVTALWGLTAGPYGALGALLGAGIGTLLTVYAAVQVLARPGDGSPHAALGAMVRAELGKLLLATVLVTLAVIGLPSQAAAIVTTLAATLSAYWFALLRATD